MRQKRRHENEPPVDQRGQQQLIIHPQPFKSAFERPLEESKWFHVGRCPCSLARSRYIAIVGTSVRERMYDASIANTTASASGTNRYFATPLRKNIGRNTMQMQSVETSAGTAICARAFENRRVRSLPFFEVAFDVLDGHRRVVHENAHRQRQAAERHDVDGLVQSRSARRSEQRIESGMETAMISVLRQLPRKIRIITPVRHAAIIASRTTP